jgi:hypothetical protein
LSAGGNVEGGFVGREAWWMRPVWLGLWTGRVGVVRLMKMWEMQENAIIVSFTFVFRVVLDCVDWFFLTRKSVLEYGKITCGLPQTWCLFMNDSRICATNVTLDVILMIFISKDACFSNNGWALFLVDAPETFSLSTHETRHMLVVESETHFVLSSGSYV